MVRLFFSYITKHQAPRHDMGNNQANMDDQSPCWPDWVKYNGLI
ncbi:hypothetical protein HMPREF0496_1252 [Lentilactobacillus hilgardii ATCC 27305]|nr:hypothetical protein HMPREF0496_1252 [Lentilactobacillus hilgardii ATCC 27305]